MTDYREESLKVSFMVLLALLGVAIYLWVKHEPSPTVREDYDLEMKMKEQL